jgi:hypothetical protein
MKSHITWELAKGGDWIGYVGKSGCFLLSPRAAGYELLFTWTDTTSIGIETLTDARVVADHKLAAFAELTGLKLPEPEEEPERSFAQELLHRFMGELKWFKDGESDEQRAQCLATQALDFFAEFLDEQLKGLEEMGKDPEYYGAFNLLDQLIDIVKDAQEELGVEVEREGN